MLDDVALFVQIAQLRSLKAAADRVGLPPATVTRRLRKLEERIGAQLVHRSARKFALTSAGQAYFEAFADLVQHAEATLRSLDTDMSALQGSLKAAAPTNISVGILQPMWSGFLKEYPDIRLTLTLSNENQDLLANQVDLALRAGPQTDERLYQQRLGTVATILVASPGYLNQAGTPTNPAEIESHAQIRVAALPEWLLQNTTSGERARIPISARITVDDIGLARQLAADGHGLALLPVSELSADLQTGRLVPVLPGWQGQRRDIFAVWPTGRLLSARAKCLRDYIADYLSERPIFRGEVPESGPRL
ncbi:LysR family transcriptional regulator [Roseibium sp.]|uniref:LysR family transcriptional regulator n=1 Tax=Roseibium sp. TaxID=1936156 RepID=UPI003BAED051